MVDFVMPPTTGPLHVRRAARMLMGEAIEALSAQTGYKFGPRGWAYYAEGMGLITKGEFDRFEKLLTDMRKAGELDPDVIEPDASRLATEGQVNRLGLMKIGNLETGGGKDLSDRRHPDHYKPYVQDYIRKFGVWKCEANALVGHPAKAQDLLEAAINDYIPADHPERVREDNEPGQEAVRAEIARRMQDWTFNG